MSEASVETCGQDQGRDWRKHPHQDDLTARKTLAIKPPAPLRIVLQQAEASEKWRKSQLIDR